MQGWCLIIMKTLNSYNILCKLCPIRIDPPPPKKKQHRIMAKVHVIRMCHPFNNFFFVFGRCFYSFCF